jgi:hypothetical protein
MPEMGSYTGIRVRGSDATRCECNNQRTPYNDSGKSWNVLGKYARLCFFDRELAATRCSEHQQMDLVLLAQT